MKEYKSNEKYSDGSKLTGPQEAFARMVQEEYEEMVESWLEVARKKGIAFSVDILFNLLES